MTTANSHKRRGKGFETDVLKWLRGRKHQAERLALAGASDEGDVVVIKPEHWIVIECKAPGASGRIDLSGWLKEAEAEAANYAKARDLPLEKVGYLLLIKARGKGINKAYVVQYLDQVL